MANAHARELRQELPRVGGRQAASVEAVAHATRSRTPHPAASAAPTAAAAAAVAATLVVAAAAAAVRTFAAATAAATATGAAAAILLRVAATVAVVATRRRCSLLGVRCVVVGVAGVVEPIADRPSEGGEHAPAQLDPPHEPHVPLHRHVQRLGHA